MLCCEQRTFWLDTQSATLSWGKSLYAKSAKSARLLAALPHPDIPDARSLFAEVDKDGSGALDAAEVAALYRRARGEKLGKKALVRPRIHHLVALALALALPTCFDCLACLHWLVMVLVVSLPLPPSE